jgi:hypothetical protein
MRVSWKLSFSAFPCSDPRAPAAALPFAPHHLLHRDLHCHRAPTCTATCRHSHALPPAPPSAALLPELPPALLACTHHLALSHISTCTTATQPAPTANLLHTTHVQKKEWKFPLSEETKMLDNSFQTEITNETLIYRLETKSPTLTTHRFQYRMQSYNC